MSDQSQKERRKMMESTSRRTVKSRCPICDGVIDSAPIKHGARAMTSCPHCAAMIVLDVEDVTVTSETLAGNVAKAEWHKGKGAGLRQAQAMLRDVLANAKADRTAKAGERY